MEAMALHRGYKTCQEYTAFHRLPLLHDWFINGNSLQQLLSLLVRFSAWPAHVTGRGHICAHASLAGGVC